jgi:hypothetical protein
MADRDAKDTALMRFILDKTRQLDHSERAELEEIVPVLLGQVPDLETDLAFALLKESGITSRSPEERIRAAAVAEAAHRLGIMFPACPGQPEDKLTITYLDTEDTEEQVEARDGILQYYKENGQQGSISPHDKYHLSVQRSTIVGNGAPASYRELLRGLRNATEEDWERSGPLDEDGNPNTLQSVYEGLFRLTHNTVCVALVSQTSQRSLWIVLILQ